MKTLLILFLPIISFSQTHRFVYEMKYKTDSLAKNYEKDNMNLDLNPVEVKFYPYAYAETDSLNKIRNTHSTRWSDLPALIRKKGSNTNFNYFNIDALYSIKSEDPIFWKLLPETKELDGYHLQKATTRFGGRDWAAWFAKDLAINEGPYKFRGLPGLIFSIQDDKENYIFTLIKSYKLKNTYDTLEIIEKFGGQKPIPITYKKFNVKMIEMYNDPMRDLREAFKENKNPDNSFWFDGVKIKSLDQFNELTKKARKLMRENNNPIEIDKAVNYPER